MGDLGMGSQLKGYSNSDAADIIAGTELPDIEAMKLKLQQLVEQGQLSPEEAQTYFQQQSDMNNISLDPRYKNAQLDALSSLQNISDEGGLNANMRSQLNDIQTDEDTHARGAREAILQNAQARGIGGSGVELLNNLTNAQDSATRASNRGFDVAAQAQQNALQSLQAAGQLGGQLQGQEFNQQSQIANANDSINRFNTQNQQGVQNSNVAARNAAQEKNLTNKQSVANSNVDLANKEQQYNNELVQQNFQNQLSKNSATANAINKVSASQDAKNAQSDANKKQLIGTGITAAAAAFSDKNLKENVEEFNPSEFLDNLTSYKYNYKNPKHGEGKQVGVMAQDLETSAPQMVEDTPEGKVVDYSKAGGPLFASMADIHERLKKLEGK